MPHPPSPSPRSGEGERGGEVQVPRVQNNVIATPRATAVTESASQIPSRPIGPDHQAATGTRDSVSTVLTTCGQKVYPPPASAPPRRIPTVGPTWATATTPAYRAPS